MNDGWMRQSVVLCICGLRVLSLLSDFPEQGKAEHNNATIENAQIIFTSCPPQTAQANTAPAGGLVRV